MLKRVFSVLVLFFSVLFVSCAQETPKPVSDMTKRDEPPAEENFEKTGGMSPGMGSIAPILKMSPQPAEDEDKSGEETELANAGENGTTVKEPVTSANVSEQNSGKAPSEAESEAAPIAGTVMAADGALMFSPPPKWEQAEAGGMFVEIEFAIPKEGDEVANGRMTGMLSGGTLDQNIDRWYGQFSQPDGSSTKDVTKIVEIDVSGLKVHTVDISGNFMDGMGPVAPKVERKDYRMLAAIVEMEGDANYFFKFYGPKSLVDRHSEAFSEMLQSLKLVQ